MNLETINAARVAAFRAVAETCPHVDDALSVAADAIKKQTTSLRDALIEALERAILAEDRVEKLEQETEELRAELANWAAP